MREVALKERKEKRGRDPVSGRTRSDVAGTDTLNERERKREMYRQTDGNTKHTLHRKKTLSHTKSNIYFIYTCCVWYLDILSG